LIAEGKERCDGKSQQRKKNVRQIEVLSPRNLRSPNEGDCGLTDKEAWPVWVEKAIRKVGAARG